MASVKETEAGFRNKVVTGVTSLTPATFRTEWSANEAEKVGPAECGCAEHADCGYGGNFAAASSAGPAQSRAAGATRRTMAD